MENKPQFDGLMNFYDEWASAKSEKEKKWGRIDKTGAWIENPTYQEFSSFSDGLIWLRKVSSSMFFWIRHGKLNLRWTDVAN